ncbi:MAG TPA: AtpZ/AtpI family protein [Thermoanaerobaculia bacterium]|jgi:F0F1-type ATP synthase assembly protein I
MNERNDSKGWLRLAGLGVELAASIGGGALLGWWIDRRAGSSPRWLAILAGVGAVGGLYNLIRTALAASREARRGTGEPET